MKTTPILVLVYSTLIASAGETGLRVRFGMTDSTPTAWDGTVAVEPGQVTALQGWRFAAADAADGTSGWKASTRRATPQRRTNNPRAAARLNAAAGAGPITDNGVLIMLRDTTEESRVLLKTPKGELNFRLADLPYGRVLTEFNGAIEIERTAASSQLTTERTDDDFPSAAIGPDNTLYVAYTSFTPGLNRDERARQWTQAPDDLSFLAKPAGGDRLFLRHGRAGAWSDPIAVTPGLGDIFKSALAVDGRGRAWIIWAERRNGNFDLFVSSFADGKLSEPDRLSAHAGNDIHPVAATDALGRVWVAWQGARDNVFRILSRHQRDDLNGWTAETQVSPQKENCWSPAIAASAGSGTGKIAIAWDTYEKGDYDIWMREWSTEGSSRNAQPVANSTRYEARPTATYDSYANLWVAWEESGETWGKNWGALVQNQGLPLYSDRQIALRIWTADQHWSEPNAPHTAALPGAGTPRRVNALPVPSPEPESTTRQQAREAQTRARVPYNNISRLFTDGEGRVWLLARSRASDFRGPLGSVWLEYATFFDGQAWTGPVLIPNSDNLLHNVPAAVRSPEGGVLIAHSSDHRQHRQLRRTGQGGNAALNADNDPFDNDIFVSQLRTTGRPDAASLKRAEAQAEANPQPSPATLKERGEVARCRAYRTQINGKELRILRGEFHRHTEISGDGGNDGPLEDMWRYGIDAAAMDWIGNGDHDNGNGREYTWWLIQKTTDAFHLPGAFDPMFSYERSVRYPEGHRNVVFTQRGVRTLPRLPITTREHEGNAPDTQMLYKYLKQFGGICAVHTSATSMGTDWRDNDPEVEPMVEIYQGCRQNYERPGAPRSPTANDAIGGWEPKGFINLALLKGFKFAYQASSDHRSTHISYALVYAENASRQAIFNAMKARRVYAATDNIIADFRCLADGKEHFMGADLSAKSAPQFKIRLLGTAPLSKVVIVKNDEEVHTVEPQSNDAEFTWTDPHPAAGKTSYYYVRGEQSDGELVWASPIWVKYSSDN